MASVYPLTNVTTSYFIPTANAIIQNKEALDVLEASLHHCEAAFPDKAEKQSGRRIRWYRPQNFATPTNAIATEGDVPTGLVYSNRTIEADLANYTDWVGVSQFLRDTSPTPDIQDAMARLGYRGALRVDNLMRAVYDAEAANMTQTALATYLTARDLRNVRTQLKNLNVMGQKSAGGKYRVYMAPVVSYDLINDPTIGGYLDIMKYNTNVKDSPLVQYSYDDQLADISGCHIIESTNCKIITGTPNKYRVYAHGEGGFGRATLNTRVPVMEQTAGKKARFNVYMVEGGTPTNWDPTGEIGATASYNFYFAAACVAGNPMIGDVYRSRVLDVQSTVA